MNESLRAFLDELHHEGLAFDAAQPDRLLRRRNLEPEAAQLLSIILRAMGATAVLEIGTSNGYSTIWLAEAAAATGGRVVSVDTDEEVQRQAAANLRRAGLERHVELRTADGGRVLAELAEGSQDVVFLDSERPEYPAWWPHPVRVLRAGGLLVVDNVISHRDEVAPLRALVEGDPSLTSTVIEVGKGQLLAVKAHSPTPA